MEGKQGLGVSRAENDTSVTGTSVASRPFLQRRTTQESRVTCTRLLETWRGALITVMLTNSPKSKQHWDCRSEYTRTQACVLCLERYPCVKLLMGAAIIASSKL